MQVPRCYWSKTSQQVSLNGALVGVLLSQSASPSVVCLSSPRTINLGFLTEGKLAAILITPSSWGSQRAGHSPCTRTDCQLGNQLFSGAVAGEEVEDFCEESFFARTSFTLLLFCFTLFILPASFYIKNPKKLESLVVDFTCLLSFC
jgi:hypothetical protein